MEKPGNTQSAECHGAGQQRVPVLIANVKSYHGHNADAESFQPNLG